MMIHFVSILHYSLISDLKQYVRLIEKAVSMKEPRFMSRTLRALVTLRKRLTSSVLRKAVIGYFLPAGPNSVKCPLLDFLEEVGLFLLLSLTLVSIENFNFFFYQAHGWL